MSNETPYAPTASADRDRDYERNVRSYGAADADPSALTVQLMYREIASLKEIIFTRLDAMDRAMVIFQDNLTRVPTDTDKQIASLKALIFERFDVIKQHFAAIDIQFSERDVRRADMARQQKEQLEHLHVLREEKFRSVAIQLAEKDAAVTTALQAAKESVAQQNQSNALAISKSEAAMIKQLDQSQALIQALSATFDGKISDIKDRITTIEGRTSGAAAYHTTTQGNQNMWIGVIAGGAGIIFGVFALLNADRNGSPSVERVIERPSTAPF